MPELKNLGLLAVVDSNKKEYQYVKQGFLSAFEHFGIPYRVIDLAKEKLSEEKINNCSALVIAQEGLGENFSSSEINHIRKMIEKTGIGLVNFDHRLTSYPSVFRNIPTGSDKDTNFIQSKGLKIKDNSHFITRTYEKNGKGEFFKDIELMVLPPIEKDLVTSLDNYPILRLTNLGRGKIVQFLISPRMWHSDYFGHCRGFDALFSRSIIWAARKPFIMKIMPPFATARIDDASGSGSIFGKKKNSANKNFAYLNILNKYGYIPNIGLFIDDITEEDGKIIKQKHDKHLAEFSPHAFSDPKNINEFPIYMLHNGEEFSKEELKENFARVDKKFQHWGIKPSKTVNAHFGEIGLNSLPFLKERGQIYTMNPIRFGKAFIDKEARNWNPKPYGYGTLSTNFVVSTTYMTFLQA